MCKTKGVNNMSKKSDPITLDELRDKSVKSENQIKFGKQMIGGYSPKQVTDYINTLTENLKKAEESFNSRLEDYASMTTMLKQERDQYGEMYNLCKNSKIEMADQIEALKRENATLNETIINLRNNSDEVQPIILESSPENDAQRRLEIYQEYEQESIILKEQLAQLKSMVRDLSGELDNYSATNPTEIQFELEELKAQNNNFRVQYEDVLQERNAILSENQHLTENYKNLISEFEKINSENSLLKNNSPKQTDNISEIVSAYIEKTRQYSLNQQKNLDMIFENMNNTMHLLNNQKEDLVPLLNLSQTETDFEYQPVGDFEIDNHLNYLDDLQS